MASSGIRSPPTYWSRRVTASVARGLGVRHATVRLVGDLAVAPDENEITAALALLKQLPLESAIVTGDAIFCQREICQTIPDGQGDYVFVVKDNQPALKADIAESFGDLSPSRTDAQMVHFRDLAKNTFTLGRSAYQRQYEPILYGWKQGTDRFELFYWSNLKGRWTTFGNLGRMRLMLETAHEIVEKDPMFHISHAR